MTKIGLFSPAHLLHYQHVLLSLPNVTVKRCSVLNPATLLPTAEDEEPHNCVHVIDQVLSPRPVLASDPLSNAELNVFVDGSASHCPLTGDSLVGYAVVTSHQTLESARLPGHLSAQVAELFALIRACHLAKGQTVNIFTDSRYAFGVVHDFRSSLETQRIPDLHREGLSTWAPSEQPPGGQSTALLCRHL